MKFSIDELLNADYGKIYRSLALKNEESEENYKRFTNVEKYIYDNDGIINQEEYENYIQPKMSDILFNENSAQYLWLFRCTKSNKGNLLSDMFSYIGESSEIKRGGLNIYKRLGWDIHVLYVYQLINRNLAQNIKTEFENTNKIIEKYNTMYNDLSVDAKFILPFRAVSALPSSLMPRMNKIAEIMYKMVVRTTLISSKLTSCHPPFS